MLRPPCTSEYPGYLSSTSTLQLGDWLLKLDGVEIPFYHPPDGVRAF